MLSNHLTTTIPSNSLFFAFWWVWAFLLRTTVHWVAFQVPYAITGFGDEAVVSRGMSLVRAKHVQVFHGMVDFWDFRVREEENGTVTTRRQRSWI